jgi:meso-butanediol dehydrogenase/(S,S)-butanediol dehydrogenase/diacetyl reductase
MTRRLDGKVAVITGTGSGQGREAARRFAEEGARIVGCDLNPEGAEQTVREVQELGGEMLSLHPLDLADEAEVARLITMAEDEFGGIDILYNNAGALRFGPYTQTREDFEYTITNEVTIVWLATKAAAGALERRGGGSVINIASVSGTTGSGFVGNAPGLFSHSVAKGAVIRMTELLAIELAPLGIRVNAICPGIIDTEATHPLLGEEGSDVRERFIDQLLVPRIGLPRDIVDTALFLASEEASYITGSKLMVDGGWSASGGVGMVSDAVSDALAAAFAA